MLRQAKRMEIKQKWIDDSNRVAELEELAQLSDDDSDEIEIEQENLTEHIIETADGLLEFWRLLPFRKTRIKEFESYIQDINKGKQC